MAASRPAEPWNSTGLPVTQAGWKPWYLEYSFMIQAITCASVPTSGAGMSLSGPMKSWICWTNLRVSRSSSPRESLPGSQFMPPLPPPNGRSTTAVFQVIRLASERASSWSTCGWIPQAPLERAPRVVVLDAVADEVADLARVHLDGDLDPQLAIGRDHQRAHVVGQVEQRRGLIEIEVRGLKGLHRTADPRLIGRMNPGTPVPIVRTGPIRNGPGGGDPGPAGATSGRPVRSHALPGPRCTMMRPWLLAELNYGHVKSPTAVRGGRPAAGGDRAAQPPPALRDRHLPGRSDRRARLRGPAGRGQGRPAPALPYGTETNQMRFPLAMNLNPTTVARVITDLVESLATHGIRKCVLLNGHGGNDLKWVLRELHRTTPVHLFLCNWYKVAADRPA